jgi:hypothetical protein
LRAPPLFASKAGLPACPAERKLGPIATLLANAAVPAGRRTEGPRYKRDLDSYCTGNCMLEGSVTTPLWPFVTSFPLLS